MYRQYGLKRAVWQPLSSKHFKNLPGNDLQPWLDRQNARVLLPTNPTCNRLPAAWQEALLSWSENGFVVLNRFFSHSDCQTILNEIERIKTEGQAEYRHRGVKIVFAYKKSDKIREVIRQSDLGEVMSLLLGRKAVLYHSINFDYGSNQRPHSDSIHMSTYPTGYLIAAWIALEDIQPGSGELVYYPGSHTLPYTTNEDFDHGGGFFTIGADSNARYETHVAGLIEQHGLQPQTFLPKKGDILIWHANLIHGGSPIENPELTRKSMVLHYFGEGTICYHELTQRPVVFPKESF